MNGVVFQMSTTSTASIAVSPEAVQAILWSMRWRCSRMSLMMPNWSFSIQPHILAETIVGMAQGMRMAARTMPRPLNSALSTSATTMPNTVSSTTETTAKRTVFQTAFHHCGSASTPE